MIERAADTPFLRLLALVEKRPGIYVGEGGLEILAAFLGGWRIYKVFNHIDDKDLFAEAFFEEFHNFVAQQYGEKYSTVGWFTVISSNTESREAALEVFFDLFRRFHAKFLDDANVVAPDQTVRDEKL